MNKHLDESGIIKPVEEFRSWIKEKEKRSDIKLKREIESDIFDKMRSILSRYIQRSSDNLLILLTRNLLATIPAFKKQVDGFYPELIDTLLNETRLLKKEQNEILPLDVNYFMAWYHLIRKHQLKTYEAFALLACFWIKYDGDRGAQRYEIAVLTGYDQRKAAKSLHVLKEKKLLTTKFSKVDGKEYYHIPNRYFYKKAKEGFTIRDKWELEFVKPEKTFYTEINPLDSIEEIRYIGYSVPRFDMQLNPLVHRAGMGIVYVSSSVLSMQVIVVSMLSRSQLREWLSISYPRNEARVLNDLKSNVQKTFDNAFKPTSSSNQHFEQLENILPILQYISKREFMLNISHLEALIEKESDTNIKKLAERLRNNVLRSGSPSIQFRPSLIGRRTHKIYFKDPSPQNIPKKIRSAFVAKPGYTFLMIDIAQFDLNIIKGLANQLANEKGMEQIKGLSYEEIADIASISREKAKNTFLRFTYGAIENSIVRGVGLSQQEYSKINTYLLGLECLEEFKDSLSREVHRNGATLPTPLGWRIAIPKRKARLGLNYLIQAVGAEIFRKWLLLIHEEDLSVFLVNLIQDEAVFEIPKDLDLHVIVSQIYRLLQEATHSLVKEIDFTIVAKVNEAWDTKSAVTIQLTS